ncbi:hypothetical protein [Dysgonomonas mossii]|uniref:Uncharacterized protein n=1 Tax=Dysgonomonas mossii DSM 22836 TaxID=742767 RepID=F8X2R7_9BACT|nr:hypothetical protein [Dysgonomonas mossii]EGK05607.1 hypothetical protein HMPREF9456_02409 [Dysgonomonas mossii DSM 22836]
MSNLDLNQLKEEILKLKTETRPDSITSERLGSILEGLIEQIEEIQKKLS